MSGLVSPWVGFDARGRKSNVSARLFAFCGSFFLFAGREHLYTRNSEYRVPNISLISKTTNSLLDYP